MNNRETELLISRYLDGTESPADLAQLDELVRKDPTIREELLQMATQDASIRAILAERESILTTRPWQSPWMWIAAAAALVVVCLGIWRWAPGGSTLMSGVVAEVRGDVYGTTGETPLKAGDVLNPGDSIHTGPAAYLMYTYHDGTAVKVGENSDFTLLNGATPSALAGRLGKGLLTANVRKQPQDSRMLLITPYARAIVKGTVLQLRVTPECSELSVQTGKVEFATATRRAIVGSGESATAETNRLCKFMSPETERDVRSYTDGRILFQDSFENGLTNWIPYTKEGTNRMMGTTLAKCPEIAISRVMRDGIEKQVASLTGSASAGKRVGIGMRRTFTSPEGATLSYDYTYEGRQRRAMEGIEIDRFCPPSAGSLGDKIKILARPAGEFNRVRWSLTPEVDEDGNRYEDVQLYFNGERIGRRYEYLDKGGHLYDAQGDLYTTFALILEVVEGHFNFDNVIIRELKKE